MKNFLSILSLSLFGLVPFIVNGQTVSTFISSGLNKPAGVATDATGNIYVADENGNRVVKYTPNGVQTIVASPFGGYKLPNGVAVDSDNNIYVSTNHFDQHTVFKVTPANVVTEVAPGVMDGPVGVALDGNKNLYVADLNANTVRKVTPAGVVSVFTTQVDFPVALTVDANGNVYVVSGQDSGVYKFTAAGVLSTSFSGLNYPSGITVDVNNNVFVADTYGHRIVKITAAGVLSNYAGSEGIAGDTNGALEDAFFTEPFGIAIDANEQIYISEFSSNKIRKITPTTLPVTLLDFNVKINGNQAKLQWQTATEQNNSGFEIYRSGDDRRFIKLGQLDGNNAASLYTFIDKKPLNGNNYYRLVQLDRDGKPTELGEKALRFDFSVAEVTVYPNPTTNRTNIAFQSGRYNMLSLSGIDGSVLQKQGLTIGQSELAIELSSYPAGIYFVKLTGADGSVVCKVQKK